MAAAAAVTGSLTDVRKLELSSIPVPEEDDLAAMIRAMERQTEKTMHVIDASRSSKNPMSKQLDAGAVDATKVFRSITGIVAKLDIQNIDTDMIIPKQFLKTIKRSGLGVAAFNDLRYHSDGTEKPDFALNRDPYRHASILIAGDNFGCGSSREHAPWALRDFGIRCVISTSFADIFYNNCFKNGMLPIVLPESDVRELMKDADAGLQLTVDLTDQSITRSGGLKIPFIINDFRRDCLLNGLDDIGLTMKKVERISAFEKQRAMRQPWFDNAAQLLRI